MLFVVGGTIRDLAMGMTPHDFDIVVSNAIEVASEVCQLVEAGFFILDKERNTVRLFLGKERLQIDIASLQGNDITEDLSRRDFTINAMAVKIGNEDTPESEALLEAVSLLRSPAQANLLLSEIIDPFGGLQDISHKVIRTVSEQALATDPLRLLRAIRIAGEIGFTLDAETKEQIKSCAPLINSVPGERIREELFLILKQPHAVGMLSMMQELALLNYLLTPLKLEPGCRDFQAVSIIDDLQAAAYNPFSNNLDLIKDLEMGSVPGRTRLQLLKLAAFIQDLSSDKETGQHLSALIGRRLVLSRRETSSLELLASSVDALSDMYNQRQKSPLDLYQLMEDVDGDFPLLVLLTWAKSRGNIPVNKEQRFLEYLRYVLSEYYNNYLVCRKSPLVNGKDIIEILNIPATPIIGKILGEIRQKQFTRQITSREEAIDYLCTLKIRS